MTTMASQITSLTVVYSIVYSDADQSKHHSSASLDFVWGIHRDRWIPSTKGQLRGKMFPFDDVIMWPGMSCEIALAWMPQILTDDKSTLVLVMALCRQATSHYLSQYWLRSMSPYGITRPIWVEYIHIRLCSLSYWGLVMYEIYSTVNLVTNGSVRGQAITWTSAE